MTMRVRLPQPGLYIVAVSGGVDSMVLLDLLGSYTLANTDRKLVVAHFDHGIRANSVLDRIFVEERAKLMGLPFRYAEGNLGAGTSEEKARLARYAFLDSLVKEYDAVSVMTAHHQNDLLETAIINMLRGTGRKGLTSLCDRTGRTRPLLGYDKTEIIGYAQAHAVAWREDETNTDTNYLRNYIRQAVIPRLSPGERESLMSIISRQRRINHEIDAILEEILIDQEEKATIDRMWFNQLPHQVCREVLATWFRTEGVNGFDRKTIERLVVAAKAGKNGRQYPVINKRYMRVRKDNLALEGFER
ncbi:MAG TPA: tRNA lysidine(34) synthetase TilS [Candidatus Saccharimonadales bacterium]|nr:tRNA lysidine(34) synthetase TilS [Candidatus Saccharimonadales bacterium]